MCYLFALCQIITPAAEEVAQEEAQLLSRHGVGLLLLPVLFARRACFFFLVEVLLPFHMSAQTSHPFVSVAVTVLFGRAGHVFVVHGCRHLLQLFPANLLFTCYHSTIKILKQ